LRRNGYVGAFWPTPLQQGVLNTILLSDASARESWLELRPDLSLHDLWDAEVYRSLPLVLRALTRMGIDDPDAPMMEGIAKRAWYANQVLIRNTAPIVAVLEDAGIPTMLLKGMPMALAYYGDLSLRPMRDVDVMVPPPLRAHAVAVLESDGWRAGDQRAPTLNHGVTFVHPDGRMFDLHWQPSMTWRLQPRDVTAANGLWEMAEALDFGGVRTRMPCPADMLIHVCIHGAWADSGATLRWITDAICVMRTAEMRLDWDLVVERIARHRLGLQMAGPLRYLSQFGDPIVPPHVRAVVAAMPSTRRERRHHRISTWDITYRPLTGHLRAAISLWFHRTSRHSQREALRDLMPFMRDVFAVSRARDIPRFVLGKAGKNIAARVGGQARRRAPEARGGPR